MAGKGLNLLDKFSTECVHQSHQEKDCASSSWVASKMYTSDTIINSQRTPTEIYKNVAIPKVRILAKQVIL